MTGMKRGPQPARMSRLAARVRTDLMGGPYRTWGRTDLMGGPYRTWGRTDLMGGPHPVMTRAARTRPGR